MHYYTYSDLFIDEILSGMDSAFPFYRGGSMGRGGLGSNSPRRSEGHQVRSG